MSELLLFTDGSVNVQAGVGFGAYLVVMDRGLSLDSHRRNVRMKQFHPTSSTKLELQTLLWALSEVRELGKKILVHTDSQNILGLLRRRDRLEKNAFLSSAGRPLNNSELYKEFYKLIDQLNCEFIKVKGHKVSKDKDEIDELFTLVDRASRDALRSHKSEA
ncbi:MAG: ribonuclease H [Verrucomicrobia bacterium]|nr:ribonuclease H [Verrucomicrobiota bacterium]MDA1067501.1 ribonuclease H [Verrucomicrobiota bacterium]